MAEGLGLWPLGLAFVVVGTLWVYGVNRTMNTVPPEALKVSPNSNRWTKEQMRETYERVKKNPIDIKKHLPPRLDRRYIVVGGSGQFSFHKLQSLCPEKYEKGGNRN